MTDRDTGQAAPPEGSAPPCLRETAAKLRAELDDYERRDDARVQGEEPPDAGWVIEAAQALLTALGGDTQIAEVDRLRATIDRVRSLHWPSPTRDGACDCVDGLNPCPTTEAISSTTEALR
ncbi:hypothetical protein [Mycobacteroides chelonae]|uniref:hypothetical protein n=1 Tax=Mycobacteroides chelonae TaxID=1774 RepID=UPI0008AA56C1|nr:hypothetical protein [Mycobacteroides chelonae]OHU29042.1 hypothetical protein BKG78_23520 [Mycobacteroides chelonae]